MKSFDLSEVDVAKEFWDLFGFIVFRDILTPSECEATRNDIWNLIESGSRSMDRNDISTWNAWPKSGVSKYGKLL